MIRFTQGVAQFLWADESVGVGALLHVLEHRERLADVALALDLELLGQLILPRGAEDLLYIHVPKLRIKHLLLALLLMVFIVNCLQFFVRVIDLEHCQLALAVVLVAFNLDEC